MPDYAITEYDFGEGEVSGADLYNVFKYEREPKEVFSASGELNHEEVVAEYYEERDYRTQTLTPGTKFLRLRSAEEIPDQLVSTLEHEIALHTRARPAPSQGNLTWAIEKEGIPDFLTYQLGHQKEVKDYYFVEAKTPNVGLSLTQIEWMVRFSFFPIRIAYVEKLGENE